MVSLGLTLAWWLSWFFCVDPWRTSYLTKFWLPGSHPSVTSLASASSRIYPWRRKRTYTSLSLTYSHAHFLGASKVTLHKDKGQSYRTQLRVKKSWCTLHLPYIFITSHVINPAFQLHNQFRKVGHSSLPSHYDADKRPQSGPSTRCICMRLLFGSEQYGYEGLPRHLSVIWVTMKSPTLKVEIPVVEISSS